MSESKTYVFGSEGSLGANNLLASILPSLQNRGIDTGYLMGLMNGNNNGGFFGNNGGFQDIIALIVIAAIFGNGNGNGLFGGGGNNNNAEREMLMSAIQRNGTDLSQLAQSLNCSVGQVHNAIDQVATQICQLTGQVGLSSERIINSVLSGNASLASQIANCCCTIEKGILESNYLTERGFCNTNQIISKGFSDLGYATRDQTCSLEKAIESSTSRVLEGQRAAELRAMSDKIDMLREKNSTLTTQLNLEHQNNYTAGVIAQSIAPVNAALSDLSKRLADIECNQPPVAKIPYVPAAGNYIPVNYSVPMHFGVSNYGGCGYNYGC